MGRSQLKRAVRAYIKSLPIYGYLVSSLAMNPSQLFYPAVAKWFVGHFSQPTPAQAQAWPAIKAGHHTLIAAPTGSGKALAAFLAAIDDLVRQDLGVEGFPKSAGPGLSYRQAPRRYPLG
jgi:superfamily II DNA/RNA helicase